MMKEIISQENPPAVASDYSLEAALQVLRGPVGAVEGGERRQKTPGKPNLLSSSSSSSGDEHIKLIQEMNLLSWERKNGSILIPSVSSRQKVTSFCPLCTNNLCICLGPSCLGKGPIASSYSAPSRVIVDLVTPDPRTVLTNLTSREETPKKKEPKMPHLPTCNIYSWKVLNKQEHTQRYIQQPIMRSKANWNLKLKLKTENIQAKYPLAVSQSVKRLLMKSSLNPSSTQAQKKTRSMTSVVLMTSHDRKMLCSEQRCCRKVSRSSTVSFNSPTSSSALSNFPPNSIAISSTPFTRSSVLPSNSLTSHSASSKSPTNQTTVSPVLSTPRPTGYQNFTQPRRSGWSNSVFGLKGGSGRSKSSRAPSSRVSDNVEEWTDDSRGRTTERCSEHERSASSGVEKHICKCGKSFAHKRSLSRHYEECLTNENNPFIAPQVFSSPSLRKRSAKRSSVHAPLTPHSSGAKICKEEESIASSVEPIGDVFELTVFEEDDSAADQFFKCKFIILI